MENPVKNNDTKGIEEKYKFNFKLQRSSLKTIKKNNYTVPSRPNNKSKQNILSIEYFKGVHADYLLEQLVKPDTFRSSMNAFSYPSTRDNPVMWNL